MTTEPGKRTIHHYVNPVFPEYFPDPFVLKFGSYYYAYCTGIAASGSVFDVLRSRDLVRWERVGAAMEPLATSPPYYWAPEVTYSNGKFYLYYSSGNETLMEIRVAVSDRPDGGFVDSGRRLTKEEFAIDAHAFIDDDGQKYLFYATDFLGHTHIGTGTVVDKMVSWYELEGDPKPVTRAAFDWQVYDPHRVEKGGVRWHTVEGPSVTKYKKNYFQMFSGGNWKNSSYGVGFATSDAVLNSEEWLQSIDGESVFPILRTIPDKVIGPGHNSAIIGPNGRERFCVYHSWVGDARVMSIDRMDLVSDRLFVNGPTFEPQPAPFAPSFTFDSLVEASTSKGWRFFEGSLFSPNTGESSVPLGRYSPYFLLRFMAKCSADSGANGSVAIRLKNDTDSTAIRIALTGGDISISSGSGKEAVHVPEDVDLNEFQVFTIEVNESRTGFSMNDLPLITSDEGELGISEVSIETVDASCEINDLLLTEGFVDLFESGTPFAEGWETFSGEAALEIIDEEMRISSFDSTPAIAVKGIVCPEFEFAANIRRVRSGGHTSSFGFALLQADGKITNTFEISGSNEGFYLVDSKRDARFRLPSDYSPDRYRQFRFLNLNGTLRVESENQFLGEVNVGTFPLKMGILCKGAAVGLDMVRMIKIG